MLIYPLRGYPPISMNDMRGNLFKKFFSCMWLIPELSLVFTLHCSSIPFKKCTEPWSRHEPVPSRFLHQDGNTVKDSAGREIMLHAVNIGGWLHWEAWIFGGKLQVMHLDKGSESQLLARVREVYGTDAETRFANTIMHRFITEADFAQIAALGFNSIRLPINHTLLDHAGGWEILDRALAWAQEYGLQVFIDMHAAPGGQSKYFTADPGEVLVWDNQVLQDELVADWIAIASRYADHPAVGGYDLLNEPDPADIEDLPPLYKRIIEGIRSVDTEHMVIIEGSDLSRSFDIFTERLDNNVMYSPHVYLWFGKPDQKWIVSLQELSACHDIPVWVGEFGEDRLEDIMSLRRGFETMAGWAVWTWKKVDTGGTPGLGEIDVPEQWLELIRSLGEKAGTPGAMTETEAFQALDAFLDAAAKPRINTDMLNVLFSR